MLREIKLCVPEIPTHALDISHASKCDEMTIKGIKVITPIVGGGTTADVFDISSPVRSSSIRGQLRFWWRATRGAAFTTSKELFAREAEIWGSSDNPSPTTILVSAVTNASVRMDGNGMPFGFARYGDESYVLFPSINNRKESKVGKEGLNFTLTIKYKKDHAIDIKCALWAWLNFGGIGARTRRGCGALYCEEFAIKADDIKQIKDSLKNKIETYELQQISNGTVYDWAVFEKCVCLGKETIDAMAAWKNIISVYRYFRQGVGFARNVGSVGNRPGRSLWPEADSIRVSQNRRDRAHIPFKNNPWGFPKAIFGMPIIFHFKDRDDPFDTTVAPLNEGGNADLQRMASPVVLRPIGVKTNAGQSVFYPMALLLHTKMPEKIKISWAGGSETGTSENLKGKNFTAEFDCSHNNLKQSPIGLYAPQTGDAINAFLNYLCKVEYFKRVM